MGVDTRGPAWGKQRRNVTSICHRFFPPGSRPLHWRATTRRRSAVATHMTLRPLSSRREHLHSLFSGNATSPGTGLIAAPSLGLSGWLLLLLRCSCSLLCALPSDVVRRPSWRRVDSWGSSTLLLLWLLLLWSLLLAWPRVLEDDRLNMWNDSDEVGLGFVCVLLVRAADGPGQKRVAAGRAASSFFRKSESEVRDGGGGCR